MRKAVLLSVMAACGLSYGTAQADTFFGAYAGAQIWSMETDGKLVSNNVETSVFYDDERRGSFYVAIEHPVPMLPNLRVIRSNMETKGGTGLTGTLDLKSTDYVLYYELFDNEVLSLDAGISGKDIDGDLSFENKAVPNSKQSKSVSEIIPMLFARGEIGLPGTSFGLMAQVSTQPFGSENSYDYQAALTYDLLDNMAMDTKIQLGYRQFSLEVDELKNLSPELEFSGEFLGLEVHF